jgi:hypothetical protein
MGSNNDSLLSPQLQIIFTETGTALKKSGLPVIR